MSLPHIDDCKPLHTLKPGEYGQDLDGSIYRLVGGVEGRDGAAVVVLCGARSGGEPVEMQAELSHPLKPMTDVEAATELVRRRR